MHWLLGFYMWLFVHRPFEYYHWLGDLQVERIYMIGMILFWLVWPNKRLPANRLHAALAIFSLVLTLCWLASPFRDRCWDTVENYLKVATFYFLVVTSVHDEAGLRRVLALFLVAVGLYMGHSMLEYVNGRYEWRQGIRRMIGVDETYRDPNAFASTLLLALPLTLPFWPRARTLTQRLPLLSFTGAACLCILLTGSRTGFTLLAILGLVLALRSRHRLRLLPVVLVAGMVLVVALPEYLQNRFLTLIDPSYGPRNAQESMEGRIGGFLTGLQLWNEHPVLGVGPGAFAYASGSGFNPHNLYGQLLSELGTAGALAFCSLLWCFWRNALEARRYGPAGGEDFLLQVSRSISLVVILLLLQGWAGHNLYRYNWLWLAAFQAITLHCLRLRGSLPRPVAVYRSRLGYLRGPRWRAAGSSRRMGRA